MNQNSVETSLCNPLPQEILQCQNHSYQQQQQRMMMYGAPTPVASPEGSHRQIALEQFNRHQYQQQQNERIRRASIQHKYQLEGDRSQSENRDAIHSQRYPSVNWNNTKSPSSIHSFTSDNSTHPLGNSSEQDSPYISSQNQMLNHTKNKHELSLAESSPAEQGMGSMPPNTIPILTQNYHRSCYQPQEQYSAGPAYSPTFYQQPQRPRLTTTLWEDEGTVCFQVDAKGICVARRKDNNMINGTKLLNVVGMSRGKRDGILKNEKGRVVVKVGAMHLKGVWITIQRAKVLSAQFHILDLLYPLFVDEPNDFLFSPGHHSISSISSPSILLQGGPSIPDQRQLSHLQTSGITGYTLDPIRQPLMPPCPIVAFAANRDLRTGAKSNGRHTSEIDMYLAQQIPAVGTDFRGLGNSAGFQYPNGGYSWNGASHFSNHSFNGYGPPYNPSTIPRYMIAGGDMFSANGSTYTGESNVTENSTVQPEQQMHCRQLQNQHQLQQNRRILQAMSSEPNEIPAENTSGPSKSGSISPKQAPSDATVNSLTLQTPSTGIYRPNDVYQILRNSGIGSGSRELSPQASETRKRSHDNGPGASTHILCSEENKFPPPLSVSPPATPILRPLLLDSGSPPSAKRSKEELSPQAAPHANEVSALQQLLPIAKLNAEEKQGGHNPMTSRNNNGNGQRVSWTNGHKINVPSSHGQEEKESVYMEQSQCIPPRSESYTFPETKNNRIDIQQLPYEFHGDGTLVNSTSTLQQSQISQQISSPDQSRQQHEHSPGHLDSKAGQQVPSNVTAADGQFSILQSYSSRLLDSQSAVGALLGIADRMDAESGCAKDQCKPRPSPTTEIQW